MKAERTGSTQNQQSKISELSLISTLVFMSTCVKLLLINSYRSTDFEVHRNWLAITHSLPLERWYYEDRSEWTLDYPPFFAYFEWMLSQVAWNFDPAMLKVDNLNYASSGTVWFQKISVAAMDLFLVLGINECSKASAELGVSKLPGVTIKYFILIFLNGALFMIDHIHFQYNGFLFGIFLISLGKLLKGKYNQGFLIFLALINLKHIFLCFTPVFGLFLLKKYCIKKSWKVWPFETMRILQFLSIAFITICCSFGPFYKGIPQILKRLFPFQRGLCHAYWAPNFWALYNTLDLTLNFCFKNEKSNMTSGLIGQGEPLVLLKITPQHSLIITLISIIPFLWMLWKNPSSKILLQSLTLCAWSAFMFGYHVHEKAILNVLIPMSLIAFDCPSQFFVTLLAGTVSIFPLLHTSFEIVLKAVIGTFHFSLCYAILPSFQLQWFEILYILGLFPLYIYENLGAKLFPRYPFLPLLIVSNYCFLGLFYNYITFYFNLLKLKSNVKRESDVVVEEITFTQAKHYSLRNKKKL